MNVKQKYFVVGIAIGLSVMLLFIVSQQQEKKQIYEAEYNDSVADMKRVFQDFQTSIDTLSDGQNVEFKTLTGQYMSCFLTMKRWNEVFPEYAAEGKLPYSEGEYGRLIKEDALIILMLELQDLYYEAVHRWYLENSMTEVQIFMEDVRGASKTLEKKLNHICIPL